MRTFWNTNHGLHTLDQWQPNCWVQVTCPTADDSHYLQNELGIPDYFLDDIADTEERARYDYDDGWILIILRIPYVKEVKSRTPYTTIPLGIILKGDVCITVCYFETNLMVDARIEGAKQHLDRKVDNADLIALSRLQDSLTYFATSIRGNETLLSKLKFKLPVDELDADLIEDVSIEMNQARETTGIYSNILESTMDTYANIINNNMSTVMKTLTIISMFLMVPTLVASLFGMNLRNGMEASPLGFFLAIVLAIMLTALFWWYAKHKSWL